MQGEISDPRAPLGGNFRPIQPINGRTMRTNIFVSSGKVNCEEKAFQKTVDLSI